MSSGSRFTGQLFGAPDSHDSNQLLKAMPPHAVEALADSMEQLSVKRGDSLFEPGDDITSVHFPLGSTILAFALPMRDGAAVEAATIGREGAAGGVVSLGHKPAFTRGIVRVPGLVLRVPVGRIEELKRSIPQVHDLFSRYADCLIAQILQAVGCTAVHPLEARCARWLLMTHDRLGSLDLPLTHEALADMFGVARTYVTRVISRLNDRGAVSSRRGIVRIERRAELEAISCECYRMVRLHYDRVLPGLYPVAG